MKRDKRQIRNLVYEILETDVKARNSDSYLFVEIVRKTAPALVYAPLAIAMADTRIPNYETVRRARQSVQANNPQLCADSSVEAMRALEEESYKEIYGHGRRLDKDRQKPVKALAVE